MKEKETMNPLNTVDGAMADCQVILGGRQYNFMQAICLRTDFQVIRGKDGKITGWTGTGMLRFHYSDSVLRRIMIQSKESGEDVYFDMLVTNDDPASQMGRQTVLLKKCRIDSGAVALFDAEPPFLEDFVKFTFKDFEFKEKFQYVDKTLKERSVET